MSCSCENLIVFVRPHSVAVAVFVRENDEKTISDVNNCGRCVVQLDDGGKLSHAGVLCAAVTLWNKLTRLDERLTPDRYIIIRPILSRVAR